MSIRSILQQLDRDISARGITRQEACEKAGLNRGLITQWHLTASRNPDSHAFRASSLNKVRAVLRELPVIQAAKPNGDELPQPQLFDDTKEPVPGPTIKERLENLERAVTQAVPPAIPIVGTAVDAAAPKQQTGDDALRCLILDRLLGMDTVKLALLYSHIVNTVK